MLKFLYQNLTKNIKNHKNHTTKSLTLQNFKNHSLSKFNFFNKVICFVGKNGSGKTNILDSIHYLSLTKSYFNHVDSLNVKFDEDYFIIKGNFLKNEEDFLVECNYQNKLGKRVKNNLKRKEMLNLKIKKREAQEKDLKNKN